MSFKGANLPLRLAILAGLVLPAGCVAGGPGGYFESVSQNATASAATSEQPQAAGTPLDLSVAAAAPAPDTNGNQQQLTGEQSMAADMSASTGGQTAGQPPAPSGYSQSEAGDLMALQSEERLPGVAPEFSENPARSGVPTEIAQTADGALQLVAPENSQSTMALRGATGQQLASLPQTADPETGFIIGSEGSPPIDPREFAAEQRIPSLYASIDHGECKGGFGPKPRKINATDIRPGDQYYIEIRMRHTPMLPVGHTYVAYGRLSPDGEPLDEKLVMLAPIGGYAGAALASGIPMPGLLKPHPDDCRIRPVAAYRVSLNAQRFERLLLEVAAAKAEKPKYLLFTYNCNHFMSRIAASVGIKPPENIYVPALEYIYAMIERNEGRKISRL